MAAEPFLLAQLSDPHVDDDDNRHALALSDAVRSVAALDPAPGAVLVSGDLTEHGSASEYRRVRELLTALTMPVHVLAGNHDDRAALRDSFPLPPALAGAPSDDYRYVARCGPLRLVGCDTTRPGRDDGEFGADRLAWLDVELDEDRNNKNASCITSKTSRVPVYVIPTDEERMIAQHTVSLLMSEKVPSHARH